MCGQKNFTVFSNNQGVKYRDNENGEAHKMNRNGNLKTPNMENEQITDAVKI